MFVVQGYFNQGGEPLFYTGRAGEGWISTNAREAFTYATLAEANRKAAIFNRGTAAHGCRFWGCHQIAQEVR